MPCLDLPTRFGGRGVFGRKPMALSGLNWYMRNREIVRVTVTDCKKACWDLQMKGSKHGAQMNSERNWRRGSFRFYF